MARIARNVLSLEPHGDGFRLFGYHAGKRIRMFGRDLEPLAAEKLRLEKQTAALDERRPELRHTILTAAQLADAEAAVQRAGGVPLLDCVLAAQKVLPAIAKTRCEAALAEWVAALKARKRSAETLTKNEQRVKAFLKFADEPEFLTDLTPLMCERWIFRDGTEGYTPLTDAAVLRAWLRFCTGRRWLGASPLEVDMRDLAQSSRTVAPAAILTPKQAFRLLAAALAHDGGRMAPYVVLCTWCMLRPAEARRTVAGQLRLDAAPPLVEVKPTKRRTVSYRAVHIPDNVRPILRAAVRRGELAGGAAFSRTAWETIRARAGLITLGKADRNKRRPITGGIWQDNLQRHTGISYLYQKTGDIKEVCRQAGNSDDTAFRHYLALPAAGAAAAFYGPLPKHVRTALRPLQK